MRPNILSRSLAADLRLSERIATARLVRGQLAHLTRLYGATIRVLYGTDKTRGTRTEGVLLRDARARCRNSYSYSPELRWIRYSYVQDLRNHRVDHHVNQERAQTTSSARINKPHRTFYVYTVPAAIQMYTTGQQIFLDSRQIVSGCCGACRWVLANIDLSVPA
eukprot:scaffold86499_cov44-Prasinocladus_malaysianus.AAC.2